MIDPVQSDPKDLDARIDPKAMAGLTLMRRLVTSLLVVMILGFLLLIGLLVTRFPSMNGTVSFDLPANIALPAGATAQNFTRGADWVAIVTTDNQILIFDADTGALRQTVVIE
ncbi:MULTISPECIES: DUF6476 family protein [Pacificibacter]|uniref:DUF6476 family protein n=1 Tax=Pacificibacter TaxID=1042323 RepID=UPI002091D453|nr:MULTISPECIES: DUF6476 family protein [Pacificibacter]MDO6615575.1 DUF6476 family protein [Pacificibacter sp. 1_MG-2023]